MSELILTIICVSSITRGSSSGGPGPYYQQSDEKSGTNTSMGNYKMRNMRSSKERGNQYDVEIGTGTKNVDSNSDDFIFHDADKNGIQRHTEITTTYDDGLSATSAKKHV
jgi:hypothetical protein